MFENLLKTSGKTTYRVAKETGIHFSTFSDWKKGKYQPKIGKLMKLADYFGVSVEIFLRKNT